MSHARPPFAEIIDHGFLNALHQQLSRTVRRFRSLAVDIEDVRQEVMTRLLKSQAERGNREPDEVREWLLARASEIANNYLIDLARRKRPVTGVDLSVIPVSDREPLDEFDWGAVSRTAESVGPPPPNGFAQQWYELNRAGLAVSEVQVSRWEKQFETSRATIYRWTRAIKLALRKQLGSNRGVLS